MLGRSLLQRLQPPDRSADPVGQRRATKFDAPPGEDLALPKERKAVAVFGDQDMVRREALGDRPLRSRRLMDGPAGPAAIAWLTDADHPPPRRHMIEHLADRLADRVKQTAAAEPGLIARYRAGRLRGGCSGSLVRSHFTFGVLVPTEAGGRLASTRAKSVLRSSKPSCRRWSSSCSERRPNWVRCSFLMMKLSRSISAFASSWCARPRASALDFVASPHRPAERQVRCP